MHRAGAGAGAGSGEPSRTAPRIGSEVASDGNVYAVAEHGAQVTRWRSHRFGDLLYLSSAARDEPGTAIRGGVPICFPWFGGGPSGDRTPSHGLLRTATWRRTRWELNERQSVLKAVYEVDEQQLAGGAAAVGFDHRFTARFDVVLAPEHARFTLRITNDGSEPFTFDAALHTYLAVSDVETVSVSGLDGARYLDKTTTASGTQRGDVPLGAEVDRIYESTADVVIADDALGRTVRCAKLGSPQTVVWNPGPVRAAALQDLGADEWRRFVCVEAATLQGPRLHPGQRHELEQQIFVAGR